MPVQKIKRNYRKTKYILYKETLIDFKEHFWAFLGSFIGIGIIAYLQSQTLPDSDVVYLIGSFGASSVLVYGVIQSPLAQPRNLIGGHLISAIIGVTVYKFVPDILWLTAPLAVSSSIVLMQMTKTLHPPGGATALIAIAGSEKIKNLGYWYVLSPVLSGVLILLVVALIFNNMAHSRIYPNHKKYHQFRKRVATMFKSKSDE
ncbi:MULTISPECIES: HPP family protein [Flavobacterium]|uniref:HPP family protein n=1 Tax=Flavobacterium ranwuense TaxID=2541725 RepID=A0ABY2DTK0_9FLAO|nr:MULTISPECIES: HPP family protein [Flavobacterium]TDE30332.1 HPP family protein [Flavobacterium ranwuense]TDE51048.1 HPP family protein [Flavobacterium sp. GT3P67]